MDTTREEIGDVTEHQSFVAAELRPFGNPAIAALFNCLFYCFPMFPRELLVIRAFMLNISSDLYVKFKQGHEVDWGACYNFFVTLRISLYSVSAGSDCEKLGYMAEINDYSECPGLGDLTGFDAIDQQARELAKMVEKLTPMDSIQREALRGFIKEFFGIIETWIEDRMRDQPDQPSGEPEQPSGEPEQPSGEPEQPSGEPQPYHALYGSIKRLFPDFGFTKILQATGPRTIGD